MTATTIMTFDNANPSLQGTASSSIPVFDKNSRRVSQETLCTEEGSTHFCDDSSQDSDSDFASSTRKSEQSEEQVVVTAASSTVEDETAEESEAPRRSVRFSDITIRSHAMILGDNPSVSSGIPVTVDWESQDEVTCDVVEYEATRPARRSRNEIVLPPTVRAQIARDAGSSRKEMQAAQRKVNISRGQRRTTNEREKLYKLEEAVEKTFRFIARKGKKEKEFLRKSLELSASS